MFDGTGFFQHQPPPEEPEDEESEEEPSFSSPHQRNYFWPMFFIGAILVFLIT